MKTKQTAEDAYEASHAECVRLLMLLGGVLYALPAPDEDTNWSEVATVTEIKLRLADVVKFVAEAVGEDK